MKTFNDLTAEYAPKIEDWERFLTNVAEYLEACAPESRALYERNFHLNKLSQHLAAESAYGFNNLEEVLELAQAAWADFPNATFNYDFAGGGMWASPWEADCDSPASYVLCYARQSLETDEASVDDDSLANPEHLEYAIAVAKHCIEVIGDRQFVLDNLETLTWCSEAREELLTDEGIDESVVAMEQMWRRTRANSPHCQTSVAGEPSVNLHELTEEEFGKWLANAKFAWHARLLDERANPDERTTLERSFLANLRAAL